MQLFRRPRLVWVVLVTITAGALLTGWPGSPAVAQSDTSNPLDLRQGIYEQSHILDQLPRAVPAYVAGFCGALLLAGLFGLYELGSVTAFVLILAIGGIVYRYYWPFH